LCEQALARLDPMLDGAIQGAELAGVEQHLSTCEGCRAEFEQRDRLRARLRKAVKKPAATPAFEQRVQSMIHAEANRRFRFSKSAVAVAATLVIALAGGLMFQRGRAAEEDLIASVSQKIGVIMRVGFVDHIHCAVFRKWPKQSPPIDEVAREMDPRYRPVAAVVRANIPAEFRVARAHECTAHGRRYIHMVMISPEGKLASLVMTRKREGERFRGGMDFDSGDAFQLAGFEAGGYLAYVVSDLGADQNRALAQSLAAPVKAFFKTLG